MHSAEAQFDPSGVSGGWEGAEPAGPGLPSAGSLEEGGGDMSSPRCQHGRAWGALQPLLWSKGKGLPDREAWEEEEGKEQEGRASPQERGCQTHRP